MPNFIQALVAIAMSISASFNHGGKPATLPPVSQQEVSSHGSDVSGAATNLDPQNQNGQGNGNSNSQNQTQNQTSNNSQEDNGQNPDTTRVSAENVRAGIQMPALIPNVAIEHSSALNVSTGTLPTPGQNNGGTGVQGSVNANSNASFGQGIDNSQPDSAKADGQAFGQATSQSARNNGRR